MDRPDNIFVIPYVDHPLDFWETLKTRFQPHIKEIYFPFIHEKVGTGRPALPDRHLIPFLESKILPVGLLLNPIILYKPVEEFIKTVFPALENLITKYDIKELTLSNLLLAQAVKKHFPSLTLTASTLMEICCEQQLSVIGDVFSTIVPSGKILRNINQLMILRQAFEGKIRLLVNESCLTNCIFRTQHFYEMSVPEIKFPHSLCARMLSEKPWMRLAGSWILPQHLHFFEGIFDEIKIDGRISLQQPERYFEVLKSYIDQTPLQPHQIGGGPASIYSPVNIESDFYKYTLFCRKNCDSCNVCKDYWTSKIFKYE